MTTFQHNLPQVLFGLALGFYNTLQCSHCKRCTSYGISVRLSHAGIVSKRLRVERHSLHCQIAKSVYFCRNQKYSRETTPYPWNLGSNWPTPPESSKFWHVLPCSASTIRASEKSSIMTNTKSYKGFPTSHQPRFYATPLTSIKWGSNTEICRLSYNFNNEGREVCYKVHYIKIVSGKL